MTIEKSILYIVLLLNCFQANSKDYTLKSPDKKNLIKVSVDKKITWSISRNREILINPSAMSMTLGGSQTLGFDPVVLNASFTSVNKTIVATIPVRNKLIPEIYNQMQLNIKGGYAIEFRAYNDGVAYRFITHLGNRKIRVENEEVVLNFNKDCEIYLPKEDDPEFRSHYEGLFMPMKLSDIKPDKYGYLPLYVSTPAGSKMVITEADLKDYPNLFLFGSGATSLNGRFPKVVLESKQTGNIHLDEILVRKADYNAETKADRTYPWRVVIISPNDKVLLENELVYKLAKDNAIEDTKWIKPGKVAWDWWNDRTLYGVNFKSGINFDTYKYYIDFASQYNLEYIVLDEGWSKSASDVLHWNPDLDFPKVLKHAAAKNVGVILWSLWKPLDENMDEILDQFVKWGIKGIKVDFMARADQYMVNFYERIAKATAKRKLLLDLHGAYKPVGLNREYPNILNYEGVKGLEQSKWDTIITPGHDTTIPFTRMVAGPMDYTPGAMVNANRGEFKSSWVTPMSNGTRVHQAAMYVLFDAPLQMFCDNPSNYQKEPDYTHFISRIPTTWDKTVALEGKISNYALVARRNGDKWYIGGITNWNSRNFNVKLDFLDNKKYKIEILKDGLNVEKYAADYQFSQDTVTYKSVINIHMAAGGGYLAVLSPVE